MPNVISRLIWKASFWSDQISILRMKNVTGKSHTNAPERIVSPAVRAVRSCGRANATIRIQCERAMGDQGN